MTSSVPYSRKREPNIREQVVQMIRDDIAQGVIGYDTRLVDHEIAASLDVSRMPVREALMQLKSEGVVEGTSRGFVLKIYTPKEIADIFEVRLLLEPAAAAQACQHRTEAGLQLMQAALDRIARAHDADKPLLSIKSSWQFRAAWVGMVPNPQLVETMQRLRDRAEQARLAMLHDVSFRLGTLERTRLIFDAFRKGDVARAARLIHENLLICRDAYCAKQAELLADR
ncbi:MAG: GntR family transcriptional regulator [Burkholderiaceae bacterium]|nr:GntR family transcriptional regulator [Burkholderiaceae bacterium]